MQRDLLETRGRCVSGDLGHLQADVVEEFAVVAVDEHGSVGCDPDVHSRGDLAEAVGRLLELELIERDLASGGYRSGIHVMDASMPTSAREPLGRCAMATSPTPSAFTRRPAPGPPNDCRPGGWVEPRENPDNRRETLVSLTPSGRALVAHVTEARRAEICQVLATIAPADRERIRDALELLDRAAGEPRVPVLAEFTV